MFARPTSAEALRDELSDPWHGQAHKRSRLLLWAVAGCIALFLAWSAWAQLDVVTRGEGRIIPTSRLQKIQSLEGGILGDLLVKEGDLVKAGQPIVRLDATRFRTSFEESENQSVDLKATIARLEAEVLGKGAIAFPAGVAPDSTIARTQQELFRSRRAKLAEATGSIGQQITIAQGQLDILKPLIARNVVSRMEGLKLEQDVATLKGKLAEIRGTYSQDAYTELSDKKGQLSALEPIVRQRQDQFKRTEIVSPVRGRVNKIMINTRGGVIQPGEPIMEITPMAERLLVEAKIKPRDVAFLSPGMPAKVKISAYDYTIYGDLTGRVEQISPDTIEEDTARGKEFYYQVLIRTDDSQLRRGNQVLPIIPGMVADVDILSGKRSVLNYLLNPLIKARLH